MTNSTVTIPAAVAHVNALITRAVALGNIPAPGRGFGGRTLLAAKDAEGLTFMPGWNLEFGEEFGNRVTLDIRPGHFFLRQETEARIGTSGSTRSVEESALLGKTLLEVAGLAHDIVTFLKSVDPQPLPEAVEAEAERAQEQQAASKKARDEALAAEKAVRSARGKKGAVQRKLSATYGLFTTAELLKLQKMLDGGQFDEVTAAIAARSASK